MNKYVIWNPVTCKFESVGGRQIWSEADSCKIAAQTLHNEQLEIRPVTITPQPYQIDDEQWHTTYRPQNLDEWNVTREEENSFVYRNRRHIWTCLDADGATPIVSGLHYVNRLNYFYTEIVPWGEIEIPDETRSDECEK